MKDSHASHSRKVDTGEFELPETIFGRDIENNVFQSIVLQCLAKIEGVALIDGNFIDHILAQRGTQRIKGIETEQDTKNHTVNMKIEINVHYGVSIPAKAEEIQTKVTEEITRMTGLHVASVHLVFKNMVSPNGGKRSLNSKLNKESVEVLESEQTDEYTDEF